MSEQGMTSSAKMGETCGITMKKEIDTVCVCRTRVVQEVKFTGLLYMGLNKLAVSRYASYFIGSLFALRIAAMASTDLPLLVELLQENNDHLEMFGVPPTYSHQTLQTLAFFPCSDPSVTHCNDNLPLEFQPRERKRARVGGREREGT